MVWGKKKVFGIDHVTAWDQTIVWIFLKLLIIFSLPNNTLWSNCFCSDKKMCFVCFILLFQKQGMSLPAMKVDLGFNRMSDHWFQQSHNKHADRFIKTNIAKGNHLSYSMWKRTMIMFCFGFCLFFVFWMEYQTPLLRFCMLSGHTRFITLTVLARI